MKTTIYITFCIKKIYFRSKFYKQTYNTKSTKPRAKKISLFIQIYNNLWVNKSKQICNDPQLVHICAIREVVALLCYIQARPLTVNYLYLANNRLTSLASDLLDWTSLEDFQFTGQVRIQTPQSSRHNWLCLPHPTPIRDSPYPIFTLFLTSTILINKD